MLFLTSIQSNSYILQFDYFKELVVSFVITICTITKIHLLFDFHCMDFLYLHSYPGKALIYYNTLLLLLSVKWIVCVNTRKQNMASVREGCRRNAAVAQQISQWPSCSLLVQGINRCQHVRGLGLGRSQSGLPLAQRFLTAVVLWI